MLRVTSEADELERRIDELRTGIRRAMTAGDRAGARRLRAELRRAEQAWDLAVDGLAAPEAPAASLLPIRDQVHQALTLLGAPAAPRLILAVHAALHVGELVAARLTSLRRDEERSFRAAPHARPYYLCAALTADLLAPARGLLAVSTWPLETRIVGPLSPRVDFLTSAIRLAEHLGGLPEPAVAARRLLWRFATSIPGAAVDLDRTTPDDVVVAARNELTLHLDADRAHRAAAADRARAGLDDAERLFGSHLRTIRATGTEGHR